MLVTSTLSNHWTDELYEDTCVGFNTLSGTKLVVRDERPGNDPSASKATSQRAPPGIERAKKIDNKPDGVRIWNWLILCNDGIVNADVSDTESLTFTIRNNHIDS